MDSARERRGPPCSRDSGIPGEFWVRLLTHIRALESRADPTIAMYKVSRYSTAFRPSTSDARRMRGEMAASTLKL